MRDQKVEAGWKQVKRRRILDEGFRIFSERGIEAVTMPEIAVASGVGRATLYRYYNTKEDLVMAIGTLKWKEYMEERISLRSPEEVETQTGAERLRFYLDTFLDLYQNHKDVLRFNYFFNSFVMTSQASEQHKEAYTAVIEQIKPLFHDLYQKGKKDGTLNMNISELMMFSGSFHILLATATRYAVGLVYIPDKRRNPDGELSMLVDMMYTRFTRG